MNDNFQRFRVAAKADYRAACAEAGEEIETLVNAFRHLAADAGLQHLIGDDERLFDGFMALIRCGLIIVHLGFRGDDIFAEIEVMEAPVQ